MLTTATRSSLLSLMRAFAPAATKESTWRGVVSGDERSRHRSSGATDKLWRAPRAAASPICCACEGVVCC